MKSEKKKAGGRPLGTRHSLPATSFPLIGHGDLIARFAAACSRGDLAHAYLLAGREGLGKGRLAASFAELLLCIQGAARAKQGLPGGCGTCASCAQFRAGSHPDFLRISPLEGKREISIKAICEDRKENEADREAYPITTDGFLLLVSAYGRGRVILIESADLLGLEAANALLKMLEEPPAGTVFFLTVSGEHAVLETVRSRCQVLRLSPVPVDELADWLVRQTRSDPALARFLASFSAGAPGFALRFALEEETFADLAAAGALFEGGIGKTPMAFAARLSAWAEGPGGKRKGKTREDERSRLRLALDLVLHALEPAGAADSPPQFKALADAVPRNPALAMVWHRAILRALADLDANVYLPLVVSTLAIALGTSSGFRVPGSGSVRKT